MTTTQTIVFGGGCFWCTEAVFQMLRGVVKVTSGYAGGNRLNPNYDQVSGGNTGHAEVIEVEFDPSIIGMEELLSVFFTTHDPTTLNRQGNDTGTQYRSAILYTNEQQKNAIDAFITKLTTDHTFAQPITTEIKPLEQFFPAEQYHQNFYQNNPDQPYCQAIIDPKIAKLRQKFAHLIKTT